MNLVRKLSSCMLNQSKAQIRQSKLKSKQTYAISKEKCLSILPSVLINVLYGLSAFKYRIVWITVLTRIQSRKLELLFNKKWQKLEYNPAQKMKKINSIPDCNPDLTVNIFFQKLQKLEFNPAQKIQKINSVPEFTVCGILWCYSPVEWKRLRLYARKPKTVRSGLQSRTLFIFFIF